MMRLRPALAALLLGIAAGLPAAAFAQAPAAAAAPAPASAAAPASSAPRGIPFKKEKEGGASLAYQSVAGLLLAALAAYGAILGLKRLNAKGIGGLRVTRRLRVVESARLSRRGMLHVVDYHGEELLFAESEHGLQLVQSRPAAAPGAGDGHA